MSLTPSQEEEVLAVLDQYACGYLEKNRDKILSLVSPGVSGFGSGADEVVLDLPELRQQITRDLSQADSISVGFCVLKLDGQMPFAWVTSFCDFQASCKGETACLEGRMTALLRNTGSRWLIEQLHFSVPCVCQEKGESYPGSG